MPPSWRRWAAFVVVDVDVVAGGALEVRLPLAAEELGFVGTLDVVDAVEGAVGGNAVVAAIAAADIVAAAVAPISGVPIALDIAAAAADIAARGVDAPAPVAPR